METNSDHLAVAESDEVPKPAPVMTHGIARGFTDEKGVRRIAQCGLYSDGAYVVSISTKAPEVPELNTRMFLSPLAFGLLTEVLLRAQLELHEHPIRKAKDAA